MVFSCQEPLPFQHMIEEKFNGPKIDQWETVEHLALEIGTLDAEMTPGREIDTLMLDSYPDVEESELFGSCLVNVY